MEAKREGIALRYAQRHTVGLEPPSETEAVPGAKEASWQQMSDETRKPSRLVEKLNRGELPQEVEERIQIAGGGFAVQPYARGPGSDFSYRKSAWPKPS